MTYTQLAYLHLVTVLPAFAIGAFQLFRRKGTQSHKILRIYAAHAGHGLYYSHHARRSGPAVLNHFGFIHIFSVLALFGVQVHTWRPAMDIFEPIVFPCFHFTWAASSLRVRCILAGAHAAQVDCWIEPEALRRNSGNTTSSESNKPRAARLVCSPANIPMSTNLL